MILLFTQTIWFRNIVRTNVVEMVNKSINGKVSIGAIEGSFFTWLTLNDFSVELVNGDTLISVDKIELSYAPLHLLKKEIRVNYLVLQNPDIRLGYDNDSIWNFEHLLIKKEKTDDKDTPLSFSMVIHLNNLIIKDGNVALSDINPLTPENVDSLNLNLSLRYSQHAITGSLKHLGFQTRNPNLSLKTFRLDVDYKNDIWKISNFYLATEQNHISASAGYHNSNNFLADIDWPSIHTEEFAFVLPTINIPAHPNFSLKTVTENNQLDLSLLLTHNNESISISGKIDSLNYLLEDSLRHLAQVDLLLSIRNFVPDHWIEMPPLPLVLNANLKINGNGLKPSSVPLNVDATLDSTRWQNYFLQQGTIHGTYMAGKTEASIDLSGLFGEIHAKTAIDITTPTGPFTVNIKSNKLVLHQFLPSIIDSTIINMDVSASGNGLGTKNPEAYFKGTLSQSILEYVSIDSMFFKGKYKNGDVDLDTLTIRNKSLELALNGFYGKDGKVQASLTSNISNTIEFSHYFTNPTQWTIVNLQTEASGHIDSLFIDFSANASQLKMDTTLTVNTLNAKGNGLLINKKIHAKTMISTTGIGLSSYQIDSTQISAELNDSIWDITLSAYSPGETSLMVEATGNLSDQIEASLRQLNFDAPYTAIRLNNGPAIVKYSKPTISIQNFSIIDTMDTSMVLKADAIVAFPDSILVKAFVKNFNLEILSRAALIEQELKGRAFLDIKFAVDRRKAAFTGSTIIENLELEPVNISNITAHINYSNDSVRINSSIFNSLGDSILLDAITPLTIKLKDNLMISWPQIFGAHLTTHNTQLNAFFTSPTENTQPKALVNLDLNARGHINNPYLEGYIDITKGELPLPKYGIDYSDIRLKLTVDGTSVQIDSLFARHNKGTLLAKGDFQLDSTNVAGNIISSNINLKANQFYLSQHRNHEIQIDANVNFRDIDDAPQFDGKIKVLRSSFFLPALMEISDGNAKLSEPLLVQAINEKEKLVVTDTIVIPTGKKLTLTFMDQLQGTIKIEIPRNTWIRSDDMQVEVFGNLDVVKNSRVFEIFGTMGIHRGYYALYGKKLTIQEGEFTFSGGETLDPLLNLKASYIFRNKEREKKELLLIVSGTLTNPIISFELEKQIIPEADAMAYLLFGQPFDDLSYGNQTGVSNAIPSRMVSGLISTQLSRTIGNTLKLDMIEIDAGDNWQNTTFIVGKYITNNLFVTYQKSFGEAAEQEISPQVTTLEYEIMRWLSLRLIQGEVKDSGIDIILKFEK